jgi:hypothetical protein
MTRGNQRDKAREKTLKEQAAAVWAPEQFTYPLHMVRGWPGRAQEANPTLKWLAYPVSCVLCQGQRADVIYLQKKKNTLSGTEFQRAKEAQAAIMRQKQEAGEQ